MYVDALCIVVLSIGMERCDSPRVLLHSTCDRSSRWPEQVCMGCCILLSLLFCSIHDAPSKSYRYSQLHTGRYEGLAGVWTRDDIGALKLPVVHASCHSSAQCFPVALTPIAWPFATMDHDISLPHVSSCPALQIRAKLSGGILWICWFLHTS